MLDLALDHAARLFLGDRVQLVEAARALGGLDRDVAGRVDRFVGGDQPRRALEAADLFGARDGACAAVIVVSLRRVARTPCCARSARARARGTARASAAASRLLEHVVVGAERDAEAGLGDGGGKAAVVLRRRRCRPPCSTSRPMPSTSTSTTSPGKIGRECQGVPVSTTSPGSQREVAREVGEELVDAPDHLGDRAPPGPCCAVHVRAQRRLADVDAADEPGPERAEAVLALHAQHRAGVGVAEVVRADVVGAARSRRGDPTRRSGRTRRIGRPTTAAISPS